MIRTRHIILAGFFIFTVAFLPQAQAQAAVENSGFGDYFAHQEHPALTVKKTARADIAENEAVNEVPRATEQELQDIEPAAGGMAKSIDHDHIGAEEKELEKKFDTNVTRSVIDRSTGDVNTRDRMGDGPVGVFMDNSKDSRSMNEEDAIGIDLKLLEFR